MFVAKFGIPFLLAIVCFSCKSYDFDYVTTNYDITYHFDTSAFERDIFFAVDITGNNLNSLLKTNLDINVNNPNYIIKTYNADTSLAYWETGLEIETSLEFKWMNFQDGLQKKYYVNGILKRKEYYHNGLMTWHRCYTLTGSSTRCNKHYSYHPDLLNAFVMPGLEMKKFLECTNNSKISTKTNLKELMNIRILVDEKGKIILAEFDSKHNQVFINESLKCLQNDFISSPAHYKGKAVKCWVTFPVKFSLE